MCVQNLKFVALPIPEIIGSTQKNWTVLGYAHARSLFSKILNGVLFGWTLLMYPPNLKSVALPVPEIMRLKFWGLQLRAKGSGIVRFERALVSSYRLFIVTIPLSTRFGDIALLCSSTPLFLTPPLISPKFPYVPLGWVDGLRATKSKG